MVIAEQSLASNSELRQQYPMAKLKNPYGQGLSKLETLRGNASQLQANMSKFASHNLLTPAGKEDFVNGEVTLVNPS